MAKKQTCPAGVPDWIVSYGDMMSLLLTFFIMLFAMSALDASKAEVVSAVMQDQFGYTKNMFVPIPGGKWPSAPSGGPQEGRKMTTQTIQNGNPTQSRIKVPVPQEKIVTGLVFFELDSDTLTSESKKVLTDVYNQIKGRPQRIEVRGHAGINEHGPNRDQMDMSYARAYVVRKYLIELGIKEERLNVMAVGSNEPLAGGTTATPGETNSYVEMILLAEQTAPAKRNDEAK